MNQSIKIVYRPEYNFYVSVPESLRFHPFDPDKYRKVATRLKKAYPTLRFDYPHYPVSDNDLLEVHTQEQIDRLRDKGYMSKSVDFPYILNLVPQHSIDSCLIEPMRWATAGTVHAMELALLSGAAINLGGGYHHAKMDNPAGDNGGCVMADIPLAIEKLKVHKPGCKVAIIDLDIHQGNGLEEYAGFNKDHVFVFDMYNRNEYPWNNDDTLKHAHTAIPLDGGYLVKSFTFWGKEYEVPYDILGLTEHVVNRDVDDETYLGELKFNLPIFLNKVKPDFIFYNAGTDPYREDPWGCTNVSKQGIIERDRFVFDRAQERGIPIVMTLSGGYAKDSSDVIADSIINLLKV